MLHVLETIAFKQVLKSGLSFTSLLSRENNPAGRSASLRIV